MADAVRGNLRLRTRPPDFRAMDRVLKMSGSGWDGMVEREQAEIDPLLEPLLPPAGQDETGTLIAQLIAGHAEPVIERTIRHKLHLSTRRTEGEADGDDLRQEAVAQLLAELHRFCQQPRDHPIGDLRGLAAVIAHRACCRWMRRRFPERHAFKNRLHYLLSRQRGFALWESDNGKLTAGFAAWRGQQGPASEARIAGLCEDEQLVARIRLLKTSRRQGELGDLLAAVFNRLAGPVQFDRLVGLLAGLLSIDDRPMESTADNEDIIGLATAGGPDAAWRTEKRIFLERLWEEVCLLPPQQRAALLLNLRDADGHGCLALFPATGIATVRQLAEAVEMTAADFAALWNDLPIEDSRIASILLLSRQHVINARKSARARLSRRLRGFL